MFYKCISPVICWEIAAIEIYAVVSPDQWSSNMISGYVVKEKINLLAGNLYLSIYDKH